MLESKDKVLEVYPELGDAFAEAERELSQPGCKGCRRSRVIRKLTDAYRAAVKQYPDRDIAGLPPLPEPKQVAAQAQGRPPFRRMPVRRKPCQECVLKHLASAFALNTEIANGYPDHLTMATDQTEMAFSQADEEQRKQLFPAIMGYYEMRMERGMDSLKKADKAISEVLDEIGPEVWWRTIGQLVQAEEECWGMNRELADRIRTERLALMADKVYRPKIIELLAAIPQGGQDVDKG
jgi:hypothetical protein